MHAYNIILILIVSSKFINLVVTIQKRYLIVLITCTRRLVVQLHFYLSVWARLTSHSDIIIYHRPSCEIHTVWMSAFVIIMIIMTIIVVWKGGFRHLTPLIQLIHHNPPQPQPTSSSLIRRRIRNRQQFFLSLLSLSYQMLSYIVNPLRL